MDLVIKTGSIDMYGALGRDFHPRVTDSGIFVRVEKSETETWDCCGDAQCLACKGTGLTNVTIFTVVTAEGRKLEIMDYEVASIELVDEFVPVVEGIIVVEPLPNA